MTKGISADSQVHISITFLIKAMIGISMMIAAYYQIQMKFASIDRSVGDMHQELVVLSSKMNDIEKQHVEELEHHAEVLEEENRSLMQKLGLKR
jgi:phage host-nuclease inhibitor protein Gam|tara:strand:+ start:371 stop:652 length:282 start_codon:yes stop_codon:yes gene_type:complete